jgi:hypothetical protein
MHYIKGEDKEGSKEEAIDEWDTGTERELAKDCSFCDYEATIILSDEVLSVMQRLCDIIKEEWQILLIGTDDGMTVKCTDYYIPEQEYGGAHVHQKECVNAKMIEEMGIVCGAHSHSTFAPYFSATDDITNNSLIRNHLVTNNAGKFVATKRVDLPCGMKKFVDAKVIRDLPELPTIKKVKGIKRMTKSAPIIVNHLGKPYGGYTPGPMYGQINMGYGTLDSLPGTRKAHAFNL